MNWTWRVVHTSPMNNLETILNDLEISGWEIFAASVDCVVARKCVILKGVMNEAPIRHCQKH